MIKTTPEKQLMIYKSSDGKIKLEVPLENETLWLTQLQIADLLGVGKAAISKHINNIYASGELEPQATVSKMETVQHEGGRTINREIEYYNLDMIISVGYRVNSSVATQFRKWATQVLKEYLIKGFAMDDERIAGSQRIQQKGYFDELLERIRAIRNSERFMYEKVKAIFVTSIDYHEDSEAAAEFYATMQNKFHFAITGMTAAETIVSRIDSKKQNAGLTVFKGNIPTAPEAKVAKNFLDENELKQLYLISEQFLSFAELKVHRRQVMYMKDWKIKLDEMLHLNDFEILSDAGKISHASMQQIVKKEMDRYRMLAVKEAEKT